MKEYDWKQLSQWDTPKAKYHTKTEEVETGLSKAICTYLLVKQVDIGSGYIRSLPVDKVNVTSEMLKIAEG